MNEVVEYPEQMEGESAEAYLAFKAFARAGRMSLKRFCERHEDIVYSTAHNWHYEFKWKARRIEYLTAVEAHDDLEFAAEKERYRIRLIESVLPGLRLLKPSEEITDLSEAVEAAQKIANFIAFVNAEFRKPLNPEQGDKTSWQVMDEPPDVSHLLVN